MPFAINSISTSEDVLGCLEGGTQKVPAIASLFTYGCPTRAPGDKLRMHSAINQLLMCPIQEHIKRKREAEREKDHHRKYSWNMGSLALWISMLTYVQATLQLTLTLLYCTSSRLIKWLTTTTTYRHISPTLMAVLYQDWTDQWSRTSPICFFQVYRK